MKILLFDKMADSEFGIFLRKLATCRPGYLAITAVLIMGLVVASALKRKSSCQWYFWRVFSVIEMPQLQYEIAHRKSTMDESIEIFTDSSTGSFFKYFLFTIISVELDSKIRNPFNVVL